MAISRHAPEKEPRSEETRSERMWRFVYPGIMLAIALVTAGVVFLNRGELRILSATDAAILKLLAGTALLYLVGIYFTQRAAAAKSMPMPPRFLTAMPAILPRCERR